MSYSFRAALDEQGERTPAAYPSRFLENATCRLGIAEWNSRDEIRSGLRDFIDTGFNANHDIVEYWDGGLLKVFRGVVTMTFDDRSKPSVKPMMTHIFYMDEPIRRRFALGLGRSVRLRSDDILVSAVPPTCPHAPKSTPSIAAPQGRLPETKQFAGSCKHSAPSIYRTAAPICSHTNAVG